LRKVYRFSIWIRLACCVFGFGYAVLFSLMFSKVHASNHTQFLVLSFFVVVGVFGLLSHFSIITDGKGITKRWFSVILRSFTWEQIRNVRTGAYFYFFHDLYIITVLCTKRLSSKKGSLPAPFPPFLTPAHCISFSLNYENYLGLLKEVTTRGYEEGVDKTTREIVTGGSRCLWPLYNILLAKVAIVLCSIILFVLFYFMLKP
jgi:hypothetical protein